MAHKCHRVYNNGDIVPKWIVTQAEVDEWFAYNSESRFGCALFADGKCIFRGYLDDKRITALEEKFKNEDRD